MTLQEIKIELIKQNKTVSWLCKELGYSRQYFYKNALTIPREIERIKDVLSK